MTTSRERARRLLRPGRPRPISASVQFDLDDALEEFGALLAGMTPAEWERVAPDVDELVSQVEAIVGTTPRPRSTP